MNNQSFSLNQLPEGTICIVHSLLSDGNERRRMLDLGIVCGAHAKVLQKSPSGDPIAYLIKGAVIALRNEDAKKILVKI